MNIFGRKFCEPEDVFMLVSEDQREVFCFRMSTSRLAPLRKQRALSGDVILVEQGWLLDGIFLY